MSIRAGIFIAKSVDNFLKVLITTEREYVFIWAHHNLFNLFRLLLKFITNVIEMQSCAHKSLCFFYNYFLRIISRNEMTELKHDTVTLPCRNTGLIYTPTNMCYSGQVNAHAQVFPLKNIFTK